MYSLEVWKVRYQSASWIGSAAKRKIEEGVAKPRVRIEVVSWRGSKKEDILDVKVG
jgi:hypothetical protein